MRAFTMAVLSAGCMLIGACAHAPKTQAQRNELYQRAEQTVAQMEQTDPSLRPMLQSAAGYVVFPSVGQGGLVVGGASGEGVIFEHGRPSGVAQLTMGEAGAVVGGESYKELVVVRNRDQLNNIRSGNFKFGAEAKAVALQAGAAATTEFDPHGVAVFVASQSGAMLSAALTGQEIRQVF